MYAMYVDKDTIILLIVYIRILLDRPSWDSEVLEKIAKHIQLDTMLKFGTQLLNKINIACLLDGTTNNIMVSKFQLRYQLEK